MDSVDPDIPVDFQINFVQEIDSTTIIDVGFFPTGITLTDDRIYLSTVDEHSRGTILVLDYQFNLVFQIDRINGSDFSLNGLDVYEDRLYFVDSLSNQIVVYDLNGELIFKFGGTGTSNGLFNTLNDVAVNNKFIYAA
ncbi:MAG: hypothetical protein IH840_01270, partial [Candidatus Heimdallarchaeota archaeon]|nr:hypothetical protein [Candidatus Heimdallarchaeota archaeon]